MQRWHSIGKPEQSTLQPQHPLISCLLGSLQGKAFHFKGGHLAGTNLTAVLASEQHFEHATAVEFNLHLHSDLGTPISRTLAGGAAVSFVSVVEMYNRAIGKPCE